MSNSSSFVADPGSLAALHREIRAGRTDPVRLLEACFNRIDAVEAEVQGWRVVDRAGAMAQADALRTEAAAGKLRSALHGIPVAIKDVIDIAGWPTRAGSRSRQNEPASAIDATVVSQLRAAGAVIVGKAHTTEFAFFDGPPPTRNPHNLAHTPGGSSSGPAAIVAAGMAPLSLGTQTAGSVSRPAAYCGIAAFKPSTLAWPSFGVVPFSPSFDTVGVFGYRVADATAAARVLMPPFLQPGAKSTPTGKRPTIGIVEDPILSDAATVVLQSIDAASSRLGAAGLPVDKVRSPVPFAGLIKWHHAVSRFDLGHAQPQLLHAPEGDVTPALLAAVREGQAITEEAYLGALHALTEARRQFWAAMAGLDALIFPAALDGAPAGMKTGDPRFIIPFTALGGPIVSIPIGFNAQGLPLGLMLASAPGTDAALADIADGLAPLIETMR